MKVTILQSSSSTVIQAAYDLVRNHNSKHEFLLKSDSNYFSTLKHVVQTSAASISLSCQMTLHSLLLRYSNSLATIQNVLSAYFPDVRFTVQLRVSSRDNRPELIGEALPTDFLPRSSD